MESMRTLFALLLVLGCCALSSAACSSSSTPCQSTCDKITACGYAIGNSTFSCAGDCSENGCAACLNGLQCTDFAGGWSAKCGVVCPTLILTKT
jgi:hypothetical protein